ncbi:MAG TPA: hypothetical protein VMC80_00060 [Patescibacteria group bacterium]|nr:hypothetical protein [Patescibacteria group bacterium]
MEDIFYLDLYKNELFGWEKKRSKLVVMAMMDKIKRGADFPAVPVRKIGEGRYALCGDIFLSSGYIDGGHNRAIAHYLARKELKCRLIKEPNRGYDFSSLFFPIKDSELTDLTEEELSLLYSL